MCLSRFLVLVGLALPLGGACGSVLGTNDGGGGAAGGTSGRGGAGAGKGGNGGAGGTAGVSCSDLATQYTDALPAAQSCDLNASGECHQLVSSSLSPCFVNCMTYVNDSSALNAIKASWVQAGCNNVNVLCPAIACLQPTNNVCLVGDGGSGTCSSNTGGGGGAAGHGASGAGGGGHGGSSGSAGSGGAGTGGSGGGGAAGAGGVSGYCNSDSDCTFRTTGCCQESCMATTDPVSTGAVVCNILCLAPKATLCGCVNHQCSEETGAGGQGGAAGSVGSGGAGGGGECSPTCNPATLCCSEPSRTVTDGGVGVGSHWVCVAPTRSGACPLQP